MDSMALHTVEQGSWGKQLARAAELVIMMRLKVVFLVVGNGLEIF